MLNYIKNLSVDEVSESTDNKKKIAEHMFNHDYEANDFQQFLILSITLSTLANSVVITISALYFLVSFEAHKVLLSIMINLFFVALFSAILFYSIYCTKRYKYIRKIDFNSIKVERIKELFRKRLEEVSGLKAERDRFLKINEVVGEHLYDKIKHSKDDIYKKLVKEGELFISIDSNKEMEIYGYVESYGENNKCNNYTVDLLYTEGFGKAYNLLKKEEIDVNLTFDNPVGPNEVKIIDSDEIDFIIDNKNLFKKPEVLEEYNEEIKSLLLKVLV